MATGLFLFGIPAAIIAKVKGFSSLRWLLALGLIGLIWVLFLKSAKEKGISKEEAIRRANKADNIGAWLCGICISLNLIGIFIRL